MAVLTKITSRSLADNAVSSAKIQDGAIAVADVADGSISTAKLADDAVTQAKIGAGAVGNTEINNSAALASSKLADDPLSGTNAATVAGTYTAEQQRVHGSTFTTTGSTITGDVVFESLTDKEVTFSGTGTITGSGGKMTMKGLESPVAENDTVNTTHINAGGVSTGDLNWNSVTKGTLNDNVTYPDGHIVQVKRTLIRGFHDDGQLRTLKRHLIANNTFYVEITPKYDNSSIFICANWNGCLTTYYDTIFGLEKNNEPFNYGTASTAGQIGISAMAAPYGNTSAGFYNVANVTIQTIDATGPTAGHTIRYQMYAMFESAVANDFYTNATGSGTADEPGASEIIAMEIAGIVS